MSNRPLKALLFAALITATEAAAEDNASFSVVQRVATSKGSQVVLSSQDDETTLNVIHHSGGDFIISTEEITASDSDDACALTITDEACAFNLYAESWVDANNVRYLIVRHEGAIVAYLQHSSGKGLSWNHQNKDHLAGAESLVAAAGIELNHVIADSASAALMQGLISWIKG